MYWIDNMNKREFVKQEIDRIKKYLPKKLTTEHKRKLATLRNFYKSVYEIRKLNGPFQPELLNT